MVLETNELFAERSFVGRPRMVVERNKVGTIKATSGAPKLVVGTPVSWDSSVNFWAQYTQPSDAASLTLTRDAGAGDGGSFVLYIDGLGVAVAWDVDTAALLAAANAVLADAGKPYTVTVVNSGSGTDLGTSGNIQTVTFTENAGAPTLTVDTSGLTDGGLNEPTGIALAIVDAGTALNGTNLIAGYIAHQTADTSATEEVQATIMLAGEVHRDDINTAAIRLLCAGTPSEAELDTALKAAALRDRGITVRGLAAVEGS